MASLNQCNFIGNAGRDAEVRFTQDGIAVANVSIAVTEKWKDNEKTEWVRLVFFKRLAEVVGDYVKKGTPIFVSGRMQTSSYEKDGQTKYITEVVCNQMQLLGSKKNATGNDYAPPADNGGDDSDLPF